MTVSHIANSLACGKLFRHNMQLLAELPTCSCLLDAPLLHLIAVLLVARRHLNDWTHYHSYVANVEHIRGPADALQPLESPQAWLRITVYCQHEVPLRHDLGVHAVISSSSALLLLEYSSLVSALARACICRAG